MIPEKPQAQITHRDLVQRPAWNPHQCLPDRLHILEEVLGYLSLIRREAKKRFRAGMPAQKAATEIRLGTYAEWMKPDRVEQAVMKLYNEFRGEDEKLISLDDARGG